jgi:hypothetical protein
LAFAVGDCDELFEGSGAEEVALEAIDRACDAVVVDDVTLLDVVETWAEDAKAEAELDDDVAL